MIKVKILFILGLFMLSFFGCATQGKNLDESIEERFKLIMDSRVELLGTIKILSDFKANSNNCAVLNTVYKMNVVKYFAPFKDDPSIAFYEKLTKSPLKDSLTLNLMLHLSNPPNLETKVPIDDIPLTEGITSEELNYFLALLREFANKSKYMKFFDSQENIIREFTNIQKRNMSNTLKDVLKLEEYFGKKQNSYNLIITPLILYEKYTYFFQKKELNYSEKMDIYMVAGISEIRNGYPCFGSEEEFREIINMKVTHAFVDPLTEKFKEDTEKYSYLFNPIAENMKKQGIFSWKACVNEHLVKTIGLELSELSEEEIEESIKKSESAGFIYLRQIYASLKKYRLNRDKYITFESFYPEILESLEKV